MLLKWENVGWEFLFTTLFEVYRKKTKLKLYETGARLNKGKLKENVSDVCATM